MVRHLLLFGLCMVLLAAGPYAYRRWKHRYICIPPLPRRGSPHWMDDRICGPADMLDEMKELVDVGQYTEPVTPITGFDGVPNQVKIERKDKK